MDARAAPRPPETARTDAWLAPHVHAAAVEDDLVVLDLAADAYACLPDVAGRLKLDPAARALEITDPGLACEFAAAGLIAAAPAPPGLPTRPWPGPPARSAFPDSTPPPALRDLRPLARAICDARVRYPGRRIPELVRAAGPPRAADPRPTPALLDAVAGFHRWSPYAPVSGKCLLRSFLLLRGLRRAGHDALWVFGVSTWPFQAHCWLQAGDTVLDDSFERVGGYAPILVA